MRYLVILLSLSSIAWATQGISELAVNYTNRSEDLTPNEYDDVEINDAIELAISNSDAELNKLSIDSRGNSDAELNKLSIDSRVAGEDAESNDEVSDFDKRWKHVAINGHFSQWHHGKCTKKCDGGVEISSRVCNNPSPAYGGQTCIGCLSQVNTCNTQRCPIDGQWSKWKEARCSKSCGGGHMRNGRTCTNPRPQYGGKRCDGSSHLLLQCNTNPCPVNGGWTLWKKSKCSKSCGGGEKTKIRTCTNPSPKYKGHPCIGDKSVTTSCNIQSCPIDGHWTSFGEYGKCSKSCKGGIQWKRRFCNNPKPRFGGKLCKGDEKRSAVCNAHPCPKYSCLKAMDFVILLDCSSRMSRGQWKKQVQFAERMVDTMYRKFVDARVALIRYCSRAHGIISFTGIINYIGIKKKFKELEVFNRKRFNRRRTDLGMESAFTLFQSNGRSEAFRSLLVLTNGVAVGTRRVSRAQINEVVSRLRQARVYTTVVEFGFEVMNKKNLKQAVNQMYQIASSKQHAFRRTYSQLTSTSHNKNPIEGSFCPVDGAWSPWTEGSCTKACGGGTRLRTKTCTDPAPKSGGQKCTGPGTDKLPCNNQHCPVDGHWSEWEETKCSKTCGGGQKSRNRNCKGKAYGGKTCKGKTSEVIDCNTNPCPIDGGWSPWSFTSCSKSCGGGKITKKRACTHPTPQYGGKVCDGMEGTVIACNQQYCPIDGNWSPWKDNECSTSCGGGNYMRTRQCNNPAPEYSGKVCPGGAMEKLTCNAQPCPVDGGWTSWEKATCSKTCGGGRKTRTRSCTNPVPKHGGKQCSTQIGDDKIEDSCNNQHCPVDGAWGSWSEGFCSKKCGGGVKTKLRHCIAPRAMYNGKACAGLGSQVLSCNTKPCKVDGDWSAFTAFTTCSKTCGIGIQSRTRSCTNPAPAHGGQYCAGKNTHTRKCNTHKCPINGNWSPWKIEMCSKTCGGGIRSKSRKCNNPTPRFGGTRCKGKSALTIPCNSQACPINGKWSVWGETACSKTCGGGTKIRSRKCTNPSPAHGGKKCKGLESKDVVCNTHHCPVDGNWSSWSVAKCNKKCDGGTSTRTRRCDNPSPKYRGRKCLGKSSFTKKCNEHPCPKYICHNPLDLIIALDYSNTMTQETWKQQCDIAIGIVTEAFREHPDVRVGILHFGNTAVVDMPLHGSFIFIINRLKKLYSLYPRGGSDEWTKTDLALRKALEMFRRGQRSKIRGQGSKTTRILAVLTDGNDVSGMQYDHKGEPTGYDIVSLRTLRLYRSKLKSINVRILTLGFGLERMQSESRNAAKLELKAIATSTDMLFFRSYAQLLKKEKLFQLTRTMCPVNGGFSEWKENKCAKSCGGGTKLFTRRCSHPSPKYGGLKCIGSFSRTEECNVQKCPVDGHWTSWKSSKCTVSCGGGTKVTSRSCTNPAPQHNGKTCPGPGKGTLQCNTQECPIDGDWSSWKRAACSKSCGGGRQALTRSCSKPAPRYGGKNCIGFKKRHVNCNKKPCPIDGNWSSWSPVLKCSKSCGGGRQVIERRCTRPRPQYGGKACGGSNKRNVSCNKQLCPVNGGWTQWTETQCSKLCAGGVRRRKRSCTEPKPAHGGKSCDGPVTEDIECNTQQCPVDGQWSPWVNGQCSKSCGGGVITKTRNCASPKPQYGGKDCKGKSSIPTVCNQQICPIDGNWSPWIVSSCSSLCGGGLRTYTRTCSNPAAEHGGKDCVGKREKNVACNSRQCPVDGLWTSWSKFSKCTKSCGGGEKERTRTCTNPAPAHGGKACEGEIKEIAQCNIQLCKLCKEFTCKGCNCNGVNYQSGLPFISPDCKRQCVCSNNHVKCKPLCGVQTDPQGCRKKNLYYKKELAGHAHGRKACYCYKATCLCNCPAKYICHNPLDLIIALDYSNTMTPETWKQQCDIAIGIVKEAFREHPSVRVGILHFGNTAVVDMPLHGSFIFIINRLKKLYSLYPRGGSDEWTKTDLALRKALEMFRKGQRSKIRGQGSKTTRILAVLTDGNDVSGMQYDLKGEPTGYDIVSLRTLRIYRSKLKSINVRILTLGFGLERMQSESRKAAKLELKAIATSTDMLFFRSYAQLLKKEKLFQLTRTMCPVNGGFSEWKENKCTKSCGGGTKLFTRRCSHPSPKYGGLKCIGSVSRTEECNVQKCPAATCRIKYDAIGCYGDNRRNPRAFPELINTDRDRSSSRWSGILIKWKTWDSYMPDLICRCATKIQQKGYVFFGLQNYGECWSGPKDKEAGDTYKKFGRKKSCIKQGYKQCQSGDQNCVGKANTNYVYRVRISQSDQQ